MFIELLKDLQQTQGQFLIQIPCGFISQEQFRFDYNSSGYGYSLLFSSGEFFTEQIELIIHIQSSQYSPYPTINLIFGYPHHFKGQSHIVPNALFRKDLEILKNNTYCPPKPG